jgi:hypothetical protein
MGSFTPDRLPELDVGDRVVAVHHLGGFIRPKVRRGSPGVVVARTPDGTLQVTFTTGHTLALAPDAVALPDPGDLPTS